MKASGKTSGIYFYVFQHINNTMLISDTKQVKFACLPLRDHTVLVASCASIHANPTRGWKIF